MSDQQAIEQPSRLQKSLAGGWLPMVIVAILALVGGIWLGRVAFVSIDEPTPRVVQIEVEDDDLQLGGHVEYFEEREVYILTINTMPPPEEGNVYVVWLQTDDVIVRAGVLNPDSNVFAYAAWSGRYESLFVTKESGPVGEDEPTTDPLISADLKELEEEDD